MRRLSELSVAILLSLFLAPAAHSADLTIPGCATLLDWANSYHPSRSRQIAPRVALDNIFADDVTTQRFGKRALDWNGNEIRAVNSALTKCGRQFRKQKDIEASEAMTRARTSISRSLRGVNSYYTRIDRNFDNVRRGLLRGAQYPQTYKRLGQFDTAAKLSQRYRNLRGMPQERIAALAKEVADYRSKMRADAVEKATQAINALPATPRAMIQMSKQVTQLVAAFDDGPRRQDLAAVEKLAKDRRTAIRAQIVAAAGDTPPMLFPECPDLLTWASATNLQRPIRTQAGFLYDSMLDEKLVPVFGKPVDSWTDAEITVFREGVRACAPPARVDPRTRRRVFVPGTQQARMLSTNLTTARTAMKEYREARVAFEKQRERIPQIEATLAGLNELSAMQRSPVMATLPNVERQQQMLVIRTRQREIAGVVIEESIKELDQFKEGLQDFDRIAQYRNAVIKQLRNYADRKALGRFETAFRARDAQIAATALPEFKEKLKELPVSPKGAQIAKRATAQLIALRRDPTQRRRASSRQRFGQPRFGQRPARPAARPGNTIPDYLIPYRDAAQTRAREIETAVHEAKCRTAMTGLDLSDKSAKRQVLGPLGPTTMGDVICRMVLRGHQFHSYETPGLFGGKEHVLKVTVAPLGYQTITLHEGEVGPNQVMLVGKSVADANVKRDMTVQQWQHYSAMLTGQAMEAGMKLLEQVFKGVNQQMQQRPR